MQRNGGLSAYIGLDIGSTTVKLIILDPSLRILFGRYQRHMSNVRSTVAMLFREALGSGAIPDGNLSMSVTGSGAIALSRELGIPFVQEVIASAASIRRFHPDTDVAIELGGEDAKITFFTGGTEQRMNETCAGGTGAFIDQMAAFLHTDAAGLNALAANATAIYPIASRCGVFAKSDVLPLLNEGCAREDIAASIFQAVVEQAISGLACGRSITGKVIFLGGPLAFLSSLRQRFISTLNLEKDHAIFPEHAEYFVAIGTALASAEAATAKGQPARHWTLADIRRLLKDLENGRSADAQASLPALFDSSEDLLAFKQRHASHTAARGDLTALAHSGKPEPVYLGIDAGSTTIKSVLLSHEGEILHSTYDASKGKPLEAAAGILEQIYALLPGNAYIASCGVTGYGGALLKSGLHADIEEVETLAHFTAARYFLPNVSFILDIGGQDIKCMHIKDGVIDRIQLNEACSAGCGSFVETFARSLGMELPAFVAETLTAAHPVDLGTRCTVFMNSRVKQAQKEGRSVGDIAAGLSYSVIRNALYKVIKIASTDELGDHVVAQGGAFQNDALLRTLELTLGKNVLRLDISGLMGAFGAALLAKSSKGHGRSTVLTKEQVEHFSTENTFTRCQRCSNHCLLTISTFQDGTRFISGNRCERGSGSQKHGTSMPDLYAYKQKRLFQHYTPLEAAKAPRGTVGIPRVLNMYENYPFWFTFFTRLGFRVVLSSASSKKVYALGMSTIPSQTVCYPAKLSHGHVMELIQKGITRIFYPCVAMEKKEFFTQQNRYNCPVVGGYPELLKNNIEHIRDQHIEFYYPFLPLNLEGLRELLPSVKLFSGIPKSELHEALAEAFREQRHFKDDIQRKGEETLRELSRTGKMGIILAGHPYHIDPEVNHGIPDLITAAGMAVLSEDSVAHLTPDPGQLRVVDQWTYHARLYRAATFAAASSNVSLVQLVSFGCGLDAITADQVEEILAHAGKLYTQIKIDEGANLGAARIRVRSLLATMKERARMGTAREPAATMPGPAAATPLDSGAWDPPPFTREMKKTHTILIPQMSPMHFQFFPAMLRACGYKAELLPCVSRDAVEEGLRHVNNDACYPAIIVIGQLLAAIKSGKYDTDHIALIISQTGGGCRATNYISFLKKALFECGMTNIPILSFNLSGLQQNPGFSISGKMFLKGIQAIFCGDILLSMLCRVRPYETRKGAAQELCAYWSGILADDIEGSSLWGMYKHIIKAVREFDELPLDDSIRPKVGLVGEILLKYHPDANNHAIDVVESEGGEAVLPALTEFVLYALYDEIYKWKNFNGSIKKALSSTLLLTLLLLMRLPISISLMRSKRFRSPISFRKLRSQVKGVVSLGQQTGEGWLLTAEMMELLYAGIHNILCLQPFGCLPNHITGKGVIKELKRLFPKANIAAVDYDPGASEVNQINRIKLMMAVARQNLIDAQPSPSVS